MNIRIQVTPELRVRLAHTDCLVVELPKEISTALEGREELIKSLTAADVPTDGEALRVERDLLSAKCDAQDSEIIELHGRIQSLHEKVDAFGMYADALAFVCSPILTKFLRYDKVFGWITVGDEIKRVNSEYAFLRPEPAKEVE